MLADTLTKASQLSFPLYAQPKLNGVRAIWDGKSQLYSRDGKLFRREALPSLYADLQKIKIPLDGELTLEEKPETFSNFPLQRTNSVVSIMRKSPHCEESKIVFNAFDMPTLGHSFAARHNALTSNFLDGWPLRVRRVTTNEYWKIESILTLYETYLCLNFEGLILRLKSCPYASGRRSPLLLKVKPWNYKWFQVIGTQDGQKKYSGALGSLVLRTSTGLTFKAGSGLRDSQRTSAHIPYTAWIRYEELSMKGIPLKPTIHGLNYDITKTQEHLSMEAWRSKDFPVVFKG